MNRRSKAVMIVLILIGLGVMFYPAISDWYNSRYQLQAIADYDDALSRLSQDQIDEQRKEAQQYNRALNGSGIEDPFVAGSGMALPDNYTAILDVQNGIMGSLSIPAIDVQLPIYHGTSETVLKKGVGHMEMTAFPIGGAGNHTVLTGHTGLPESSLLTDLIDLEIGDVFYIQILDETLAYQVDQIIVVEPTDTAALLPVPGEDYVTLVTCTPYGINSHRLFVRGYRIPYTQEEAQAQSDRPADLWGGAPVLYIVAAILPAGILLIVWRRRRKNRRKRR